MGKKWLLLILLSPLGAFLAFKGSEYFLNDRFWIKHVQAPLPSSRGYQGTLDPTIKEALSQPFYYLGHGSQVFVFVSEDQKYVLKLINFRRLRLASWLTKLPYPSFLHKIRQEKMAQKRGKQERLKNSLKLAHNNLKKECGLVYLHLKKTSHLNTELLLSDKLQRPWLLSADNTPFILQRRGDPLYPYLLRQIEEGNIAEAKEALKKLIALLTYRMEKGIDDSDPFLAKNAGFVEDVPCFLDVGAFHKNLHLKKGGVRKTHLQTLTRRLSAWLYEQSEELGGWLDSYLDNI